MATSPPPPFILFSLLYIPLSLLTALSVLLAKDIVTLPYLTPIAHLLTTILTPIISPITPFMGPLYPISIIHIWFHLNKIEFQPSTAAKVAMAGMIGQYIGTGSLAVQKVLGSWREELIFDEAWKGWVELGVLVALGVAEAMGLKWEGGLIDGSVERGLREWEEGYGEKERQLEKGNENAIVGSGLKSEFPSN